VRREAANRVDVDCWYAQGVMLAKPDKLCSGGRSDNLLKVKSAQTTEALVVGHQAGKGKNVGVMGALECKLRSGKKFKVRPACPRSRASMSSLPARQRLSHGVFHCVSLAVSPTVSPSPSLPLCLSHRLFHCVSLTVSPTGRPSPSTVSPTVSLSPCLSL
jgi:hypothetical protein